VIRGNLISSDTWEKYYYKLLVQNRIESLRKNEKLLEKGIGKVIEVVNNTLKHATLRVKAGRATGPGDSPIELIKHGGQKLLEVITIWFNKIIIGEKVPEDWKFAIITSINKKEDKRKYENYRGI